MKNEDDFDEDDLYTQSDTSWDKQPGETDEERQDRISNMYEDDYLG